MRLLFCALTGMGNAVLEALLAWPRLSALAVITRQEAGPFPHYPCGQLDALCAERGIPCRTDLRLADAEGLAFAQGFAPDVLLCATFHQRIPAEMLALPTRAAVNIHPSLLPGYRGPTPTNWAILRGETETGVSFHQLSEGLDEGGLYAQKRLAIGNRNDGELRQALAGLAAGAVRGVLDEILAEEPDKRLAPMPQDASQAFWLPKAGSDAGLKLLLKERPPLDRLQRGLSPLPGPEFLARVLAGLAD